MLLVAVLFLVTIGPPTAVDVLLGTAQVGVHLSEFDGLNVSHRVTRLPLVHMWLQAAQRLLRVGTQPPFHQPPEGHRSILEAGVTGSDRLLYIETYAGLGNQLRSLASVYYLGRSWNASVICVRPKSEGLSVHDELFSQPNLTWVEALPANCTVHGVENVNGQFNKSDVDLLFTKFERYRPIVFHLDHVHVE